MQQRTLFEYQVIWGQEERTVNIGGHDIRLTPTQYRLLVPLLEGRALSYKQLVQLVYHCTFDERMRRMLDKHVERMRGRMLRRQSPLRIYTIPLYGYILLPTGGDEEKG